MNNEKFEQLERIENHIFLAMCNSGHGSPDYLWYESGMNFIDEFIEQERMKDE